MSVCFGGKGGGEGKGDANDVGVDSDRFDSNLLDLMSLPFLVASP